MIQFWEEFCLKSVENFPLKSIAQKRRNPAKVKKAISRLFKRLSFGWKDIQAFQGQ